MGALYVLLGLLSCWDLRTVVGSTCPGFIDLPGYGRVALVNAKWNVPGEPAGAVEVRGGAIVPGIRGRTYFGESCADGTYSPSSYAAVPLLGRTLRFTTDVSGAGCGCNVALYLVSMRQNSRASGCFDFYCDANSVCGVPCAEIDLQEANMHAWHSTLHTASDGSGIGAGYGGGESWDGHRDWTREDYGPNGICIETSKPFQVAVSFPVDGSGQLAGMTTVLSQTGKPCSLSITVGTQGYGTAELTEALRAGMTPVISYWSSEQMLWMDGPGADGRGPCRGDTPAYGRACADSVKFYDFSLGPTAHEAGAAVVPGKRRLRNFV